MLRIATSRAHWLRADGLCAAAGARQRASLVCGPSSHRAAAKMLWRRSSWRCARTSTAVRTGCCFMLSSLVLCLAGCAQAGHVSWAVITRVTHLRAEHSGQRAEVVFRNFHQVRASCGLPQRSPCLPAVLQAGAWPLGVGRRAEHLPRALHNILRISFLLFSQGSFYSLAGTTRLWDYGGVPAAGR